MWDAVAGAEKIYCSTGKSTTLKLGYAGYRTRWRCRRGSQPSVMHTLGGIREQLAVVPSGFPRRPNSVTLPNPMVGFD